MHKPPVSFRFAVPMLLSLAVSAAAQVPAPAPGDAPAPAPAAAPATPAAPAPPTPAPASPAVPPAAAMPATAPATRPAPQPVVPFSTTRPATTLSSKIKFNFKDAPVDDILNYLSSSFGFILIKDQGTGRLTGRVTVSSPVEVDADEAISTLDSILKPYNLGLVRTDKVLRLMVRSDENKIAPVFVGNKYEDIKPTDDLRTQIIPLYTLDPVKLKTDLTGMFTDPNTVIANAASNTITITDTAANVRHLVEMIAAMDQQKATLADIRVFKLQYGSSASVATLINNVFGTPTGSTGSTSTNTGRGNTGGRGGGGGGGGGFPGFGGGGGRGGAGGGRGGGGGFPGIAFGGGQTDLAEEGMSGKITASSDDRTNTVVVTGPTAALETIAKMINQIDSDPALETNLYFYPLKNADAVNLANILNNLFGNGGSSGTSNRTNTGFTALGTNATSGLGGGGGGGGGSGANARTGGATTTGATGRTGTTNSNNNSGATTASADLIGQAFVVADTATNSLLVTVKKPYKAEVDDLIAKLDRDVAQVLIKVLVCEVTHTDSSNIGVEYQFINQRSLPTVTSAGVAGTTQGGQNIGTQFSIDSAIAAAAATGTPGGFVANIVESNLSATIQALATEGKLDVLSRPSILATDNQLASVMVGQLVPIITSSNITSVGNIVNSVTYQQVGIILNVTPHINPDGMVIMDVAPTISQLSNQTVTVQAGVNVPVIDQRQAQSRVTVRSGQTVIIGGLMQDQLTSTVNKIPLLGDIPYLGQLFSDTTKSKSKTELLIFLTPQVAFSPDALVGMTKIEKSALQLVPGAVGPGIFDQHMQGMSRGGALPSSPGAFPVITPEELNPPPTAPQAPNMVIPPPAITPAPER